ncbi:hypothetical protein IVB15_05130 [Bradyrhizobium sp. 182]|uniref:hypothetical protein n=1 Tax=unclassified Bradyrhizobium TaxID=2631580 RepID=UPI001FF9B7A6|nr:MULTISPECIES: hypothetical protein [unclassified Bradyrhizobium]MCK1422209.1 hypothetical protein [Bradyrhizobium sp. CW12]MCK1527147.1 hypothetical protein [Bradyrhizobium sp. 182]MCK1618971.1 hypothetical protein [Bradyrhizobium sp. 159]MCK1644060.1 hypothetical protein [Bradyrhizobium sp. 154]MCK1663557.1 hypothetical protein [Bradyrhizobium sp. 153]
MGNIVVYDRCPENGDTTFDLKPFSFCCDARSDDDPPSNWTLAAALRRIVRSMAPMRIDLNAPAVRWPHT